MREEEKRMIRSMVFPFLLVLLLWAVRIIQSIGGYDLGSLGIYPLEWSGLVGIITAPFIHGDFSHLLSNTLPLIVLGSALFYFYKDLAPRIFGLIWIITGFWVWVAARPAYHIGASGVVYGLAMFIFASGVIRKHTGLMAVALVVVFLYGSLVWGIFPEFFPGKNISWESHLMGLVAGLILAVYYRKEGPQRRKYQWEIEEEEEEKRGRGDLGTRGPGDMGTGGQGEKEGHPESRPGLDEGTPGDNSASDTEDPEKDAYWNTTISDEEIKEIRRIYRPGQQGEA
jgi:membrane associated rhomboid family serine protease